MGKIGRAVYRSLIAEKSGFYDWRSCTSVWAPISATDHEIERLLSGFTLLGGLDGLLCSFLLALQRIGF
jgi:hypothetical protein